jgi:hypothetical protein
VFGGEDQYFAGLAIQHNPGNAGGFPKVVLMNKTTFQEYFENL